MWNIFFQTGLLSGYYYLFAIRIRGFICFVDENNGCRYCGQYGGELHIDFLIINSYKYVGQFPVVFTSEKLSSNVNYNFFNTNFVEKLIVRKKE